MYKRSAVKVDSSDKKKLLLITALFFLILNLASCQYSQKSISNNFVNAYCDLRAVTERFGKANDLSNSKRDEILTKYGFSKESFKAEVKRIKDAPDLWSDLQEKIVLRLDTLLHENSAKIKEKRMLINKSGSKKMAKEKSDESKRKDFAKSDFKKTKKD